MALDFNNIDVSDNTESGTLTALGFHIMNIMNAFPGYSEKAIKYEQTGTANFIVEAQPEISCRVGFFTKALQEFDVFTRMFNVNITIQMPYSAHTDNMFLLDAKLSNIDGLLSILNNPLIMSNFDFYISHLGKTFATSSKKKIQQLLKTLVVKGKFFMSEATIKAILSMYKEKDMAQNFVWQTFNRIPLWGGCQYPDVYAKFKELAAQ